MHPKSKRTQKGFTLVELMVAVTIIGILAAIGIPRVFSYVRTSSTAEVSRNAGAIMSGLDGYAQSQLKTAAELQVEIDGTTVTPEGDGTLTAFAPQIEVPLGSNFDYTIDAIVATGGPKTGEVVYCITATGQEGAAVEGGQVLYTSVATTATGWDGQINRIPFVNGADDLTGATAGGYCSAAGVATATCTSCAEPAAEEE